MDATRRTALHRSKRIVLLKPHAPLYGEAADLEQADLRPQTVSRPRQFYAPVVTNASSRGRKIYGGKKNTLVVVFMCAFKYKNYIRISDYLHYGLKYL